MPRNWHEFEKTWKSLRRTPERFDSYVLALPLQNWTALFGSMMTGSFILSPLHYLFLSVLIFHSGEALADILDATARLVSTGSSSPTDTLQRLLLLAALPRFKMLLMFLEESSMASLRICVASADMSAEFADTQANVRQLWGMK